ncbi:unnamed protein product [Lactuca virosa]|uniref:Uncharacterized protein n=1 Tax=Lactuca virosa TaxID=75947 RepID=A0AAU9N4N4_9ASTR|nr:unnamed protein product [Lactuca virosa]
MSLNNQDYTERKNPPLHTSDDCWILWLAPPPSVVHLTLNSPLNASTAAPTRSKESGSSNGETGQDKKPNGEDKSPKTDVSISSDPSEKGEAAAEIYPPPKLGQFYDFFSFSRLNPIIQWDPVIRFSKIKPTTISAKSILGI